MVHIFTIEYIYIYSFFFFFKFYFIPNESIYYVTRFEIILILWYHNIIFMIIAAVYGMKNIKKLLCLSFVRAVNNI